MLIRHDIQQVCHERDVVCLYRFQAQFFACSIVVRSFKFCRKGINGLLGEFQGFFVIGIKDRYQCLSQTRKIPMSNRGLVSIGIAALMVDRTEYRAGMIGIHKSTRTIVDRFPADRGVVGIHHAMDKSNQLPRRHQQRLGIHDGFKQCEIGTLALPCIRVMAVDGMISQLSQGVSILASCKKLESPDADMTAGNTG